MNSWSYFLNNNKRVIHKWKHYFPIYDRHFARFVNRPSLFIEIGCGHGGSLQMWKALLGPHAQIVGVDIRPQCKAFEEDQVAIRIGDQSDTNFLQNVLDEFGAPDIVLDDGSHIMSDLKTTFNYLYPRTSPTGVYLVEDLHTAYWEEYEGGLVKEGSFIELTKSLIDELNAEHTRNALPETEFSKTTQSIHIYDSICVFEKGRTLPKSAPQIGAQA